MKRKLDLKYLIVLLLIGVAVAGCSLFSGPMEEVKILSAVFDSDFDRNGIITVKMIPIDTDGKVIESIDDIEAVAFYDDKSEILDTDLEDRVNASTFHPWAFAVDIDSSGSMSSKDGNRVRVAASKLFVKNILNAKSSSEFNIYDFGNGSTSGFADTRQLTEEWTSDQDDIDNAIDRVSASGGTPLYESVYEVLQAVEDEKSSMFWQRALLVLSDGAPSSTDYRNRVYDYAVDKKIPVNTVSLGSGSYEATMSELAEKTGGIYTGADDAVSLVDAFESISLGTSDGYLVYSLKFRNPSELSQGIYTSVKLKLSVSYKKVTKIYEIDLN